MVGNYEEGSVSPDPGQDLSEATGIRDKHNPPELSKGPLSTKEKLESDRANDAAHAQESSSTR